MGKAKHYSFFNRFELIVTLNYASTLKFVERTQSSGNKYKSARLLVAGDLDNGTAVQGR